MNTASSPALRYAKALAFLLLSLPALWLAWRTWMGALGVNPVETLTHATGLWSLRILLLCLLMTPLQRLFRWIWPIRLRRMLGLFAFFYACLHFSVYLVFDQFFDWHSIARDIVKRPYITVGFAAFMLLIPLAVTSTQGWIRALGPNWKRLHRSIYAIALLAILHFIWKTKADLRDPLIYLTLLAVLLVLRLPLPNLLPRRI
jgi:sulfoxide reductase heme-binding subunit YedZ